MSQLTDYALRFPLEGGAPVGVPPENNPWEMDRGQHYLKYDSLTIQDGPDDGFGLLVEFCYHGRAVCCIRIEGASMHGQTLRLGGMEGRYHVTVS